MDWFGVGGDAASFNNNQGNKAMTDAYDIDVDGLNKGDELSAADIEPIVGVLRSHPQFRLEVLQLQEFIRKRLAERGKPATVALHGDGLRVLLDSEAIQYNERSFRHGIRRAGRSHRRMQDVDPSQLTNEERNRLDRAMVVQGAILHSVASTRQRIALRPHQRIAPAMS